MIESTNRRGLSPWEIKLKAETVGCTVCSRYGNKTYCLKCDGRTLFARKEDNHEKPKDP